MNVRVLEQEQKKDWYRRNKVKLREKYLIAKTDSVFVSRTLARSASKREETRNFLRNYKKKNPCIGCSESDFRCLEFDHRNPNDKSFTIAQVQYKSVDALQAEIAKCDILCGNCHRKKTYLNTKRGGIDTATRRYAQKRRRAFRNMIASYKYDNPCVDCEERDVVVLDFDHRDRKQKEFTIGAGYRYGRARVLREIFKCDVRCCNCHRKKTYDESQEIYSK